MTCFLKIKLAGLDFKRDSLSVEKSTYTAVKTTKIRITVVYPDKAASFIDRDTKHSVRRGGCRARKRIIYGNF